MWLKDSIYILQTKVDNLDWECFEWVVKRREGKKEGEKVNDKVEQRCKQC